MEEDRKTLTHVSPFLTNEHLDEALTKWFKEEVHFSHWEYVGETGKGDSYLSELIRIRIFGNTKSNQSKMIQVILKNIPKSVSRRLTFRSNEFFQNEIMFYQKVLPELLKFQASKNISDPFDNYAKVLTSYCDGQNDFLALEDVSVYGFGSAIRQKGIDLEHCKLTLKTFAKFHAISFAFKDQNSEKFSEISDFIFETYYHERIRSWYEVFWMKISAIAVDAIEKEYPESIYEKKLKEFLNQDIYKIQVDAACNSRKTGVISHGDSWTNNFLFHYVEGSKPINAIMIDFQLARCASPVLDVSFFIYACTTKDLRDSHYDELMQYYHDILAIQIREMGSDPHKIYPWSLFQEELKKYSFFGLCFSFESTPFIVLDPEDAIDMSMEGEEKLNIADVFKVTPFKTKEGRLREADNIVHCIDRGLLRMVEKLRKKLKPDRNGNR